MEPIENTQPTKKAGRPKNITDAVVAERARKVREQLSIGKARKEICFDLGITVTEYHTAVAWLGKAWRDNAEAFYEFRIAGVDRLLTIQEEMRAVTESKIIGDEAKVHLKVKLLRCAQEVHSGILDFGLKLGVLEREALKIEERRPTEVSFGDERGFWNQPAKTVAALPVAEIVQ